METQIDVVVISRNKELTKGIFKKGTVITIDLEEMECYHSGLTWNVKRIGDDLFCLRGDDKTVMEIV